MAQESFKQKIGIIIQARMTSSRLPGKVMKKLAGREMLWHVVERCKRSKLADKVIVATSTDPSDDIIYKYCKKNKIDVFRGNLNNVLSRYYECAKKYKLETVVRITSDCPLVDPKLIDEGINLFRKQKVDYLGNGLYRVFPRGLDIEIFSFHALNTAFHKVIDPQEQEHITQYIMKNFSSKDYVVPEIYHANFRLTVDEQADYDLMSHIYDAFFRPGKIIDTQNAIAYLKANPELATINNNTQQKEVDVIIVLSGSLTHNTPNSWRSSILTDTDKDDKNIIPDSYLRVLATAYLGHKNLNYLIISSGGKGYFKNLPDAVTASSVLKSELEKLNIPANTIIQEENSDNTYQQLIKIGHMISSRKAKQILIVSNKWHLPRIKAMLKYAPGLKVWGKIKKIRFIAAENIAAKYDPSLSPLIKKFHNTEIYKKRLKIEKKSLEEIKDHTYKYI